MSLCGHLELYKVTHNGGWSDRIILGYVWLCEVMDDEEWSGMCACAQSYIVLHSRTQSHMVTHGPTWSHTVTHGPTWSFRVPHRHTQSHMAVVTCRARSLCLGQDMRSPSSQCSLRDAKHQPRLSKEFVSSQDWRSIKGKLHILLSNPGLIYVCLKDAN